MIRKHRELITVFTPVPSHQSRWRKAAMRTNGVADSGQMHATRTFVFSVGASAYRPMAQPLLNVRRIISLWEKSAHHTLAGSDPGAPTTRLLT